MLGNAVSLCNAFLTILFSFVKEYKTNHGPREYNKTARAVVSIFDSAVILPDHLGVLN